MSVLHEFVRVTKPGGRLVLSDPDQESLVIHVPGLEKMSDDVKSLRRDVGYSHGRIASKYSDILGGLGLSQITVDAFALVLTNPRDAFGIEQWPRSWRDRGIGSFTPSDLNSWESALKMGVKGFLLGLTYFVVSGVCP
jgi:hypothetical protein